jgi:serine/threonine protein kinase
VAVASYKVAGRYELGSTLGAGGMAQVFRAHDELLDRDVAVKLFNSSGDPRGPDRVRVEMRTLAGLSHPALVAVYDAGTDVPPSGSPRAFLVMALVEGPTLSQLLLDGPLPVEAVRSIGLRMGEALDFVHSRGIVHRDVKPANVLLDQDGVAYLADFGIARGIEQATLTTAGQILGTAAFLSPEQVSGHPVTTASDIYALGLVMLEALTGRREYPGTSIETALARLSRTAMIDAALPSRWRELLADMTAMDPRNRPTAAQVATVLRGRPLPPQSDASLMAGFAVNSADPRFSQSTKVLTGDTFGVASSDSTTSVLQVKVGVSRRHKVTAAVVGLVALAVIGVAVARSATNDRSTPPAGVVTTSPTVASTQLDQDLVRLRQLVKP